MFCIESNYQKVALFRWCHQFFWPIFGLNFFVKFLASNIKILKECEFCIIAFSFFVTPTVLCKLQIKHDDNPLIVESGQSSEALHQHGLPKLREWSGGGHCQCFLLAPFI